MFQERICFRCVIAVQMTGGSRRGRCNARQTRTGELSAYRDRNGSQDVTELAARKAFHSCDLAPAARAIRMCDRAVQVRGNTDAGICTCHRTSMRFNTLGARQSHPVTTMRLRTRMLVDSSSLATLSAE